MSKWEREDVQLEEPPHTVVINRRPWVYLDFSKVRFNPIKFVIILAILADLVLTVLTTVALLGMLASPNWPNAGLVYGGLLTSEVGILFCLMVAYAMASDSFF